MSVEQSLRLLLLLHYGIVRADTGDAPHVLYKAILRESGGKSGIRRDIVVTANALGRDRGLPATDEKEIRACLRKHDSSYANFRHFQLNRQGGLNPGFGFQTPRSAGASLPGIGTHQVEHGRDNEAQASGLVRERGPRVGNDRRYPGFEGAHAGALTAIHTVQEWARVRGHARGYADQPDLLARCGDRNSTSRNQRSPGGDGGAAGGDRSDSRTPLEPLGKPPGFTVLTPPERGFSVYGYGDSEDPGPTGSRRLDRRRLPRYVL